MIAYRYIDGTLAELDRLEKALGEADDQLQDAQMRRNFEAVKFAAVRDEASGRLRGSPYRTAKWPDEREGRGRFRFVRMNPSDAAFEALLETDAPLTVAELSGRLREGGLRIVPRAVNAALMRRSSIERLEPEEEGGPVRYRAEDVDVDDLPF